MTAESRTRIGSDVDFERDGKQVTVLRMEHSVTRSAYGVVPGGGSRPVQLITAPGPVPVPRIDLAGAEIELVRCFADERVFRPPAEPKLDVVLLAPRKRLVEAEAIEKLRARREIADRLVFATMTSAAERARGMIAPPTK